MKTNDRLDILKNYLTENPADAFIHYAIGLEYMKQKDTANAIRSFDSCLEVEPSYLAAYYQLGKAFELSGNKADSNRIYLLGMDLAGRKNDTHTLKELTIAWHSLNGIEDEL